MSPQSQRDWRAVADGQFLLLFPGSESTESSLHSSHLKFLFPLVLLCRTAGHQLPQCQCATVGHISFLREGSCFLLHTEFAVTLIIIELLQIGVIFIMAGVLDHVSAIFGGSADFGCKLKQLQILASSRISPAHSGLAISMTAVNFSVPNQTVQRWPSPYHSARIDPPVVPPGPPPPRMEADCPHTRCGHRGC